MPTPPFPEHVRELLAKPNPAVIATLREDGHPVTVPTWYLLDGERIFVNMDAGRKRIQHLRNDCRVSLSVLDEAGWYTHVSVVGRVVEMSEDEELQGIDRLSRHYTGRAYPNRDDPRVDAWVEVERWHGWGAVRTG
jgi:PPOX class probable F420-dependent enzyme